MDNETATTPTGAECVNVDRARGQVAVEVFAPECRGDRGLSPITVIFANGEFDHIRVCDDLDDSDEAVSVEAWVEENGDECWASLEDHRRGPTLSLRVLCAFAVRLSAEGTR